MPTFSICSRWHRDRVVMRVCRRITNDAYSDYLKWIFNWRFHLWFLSQCYFNSNDLSAFQICFFLVSYTWFIIHKHNVTETFAFQLLFTKLELSKRSIWPSLCECVCFFHVFFEIVFPSGWRMVELRSKLCHI